jgi:CheY-like chemotaxis protein
MIERKCYRILLVDDEPNILDSMAMVLRSTGYDVTTAKHGTEALRKLELGPPDLLISDLNMPEMSGFELLSQVRLRYPTVQLLAISGIYDAGGLAPEGVVADGFYAKGRNRPEKLLGTVAELIGKRRVPVSESSVSQPPILLPAASA